MTLTARALDILSTLVAFDTTSRLSNLALIGWVEAYLDRHGVPHRRAPNPDGTKTNLLATVGPMISGGVVLSGHTDVVPVDGQPWITDPFTLTAKDDGRLYGRGTCDMKGFLALALAAVPDLVAAGPKKPVHLAFSYDEEIGCLGAPDLIGLIGRELPAPALVVVGEPTKTPPRYTSYFAASVAATQANETLLLVLVGLVSAVGVATMMAVTAAIRNDCAVVPLQSNCCNCCPFAVELFGISRQRPLWRAVNL